MKKKSCLYLLLLALFLSSCLGFKADITLNKNGNGTIDLQYHISKSLDSLGKMDGNERWNTIPAGRADFERTLGRVPDIKLLSFSSGEDDKNIIITSKLEFSSINGLTGFLDALGRHSSFEGDSSRGHLVLVLSKAPPLNNSSLKKLLSSISAGYTASISFTFPENGSLKLYDGQGNSLNRDAENRVIISEGKKVSFILPIYDLLSSDNGITAEFIW